MNNAPFKVPATDLNPRESPKVRRYLHVKASAAVPCCPKLRAHSVQLKFLIKLSQKSQLWGVGGGGRCNSTQGFHDQYSEECSPQGSAWDKVKTDLIQNPYVFVKAAARTMERVQHRLKTLLETNGGECTVNNLHGPKITSKQPQKKPGCCHLSVESGKQKQQGRPEWIGHTPHVNLPINRVLALKWWWSHFNLLSLYLSWNLQLFNGTRGSLGTLTVEWLDLWMHRLILSIEWKNVFIILPVTIRHRYREMSAEYIRRK